MSVDENKKENDPKLAKQLYAAPQVVEVFYLEALAVVCTDTNAKNEVALGCNPGALFS